MSATHHRTLNMHPEASQRVRAVVRAVRATVPAESGELPQGRGLSLVPAGQAMAVIADQMFDPSLESPSGDAVDAVLDSIMDNHGRLVPARLAGPVVLDGEPAAQAEARAKALEELRRNAFADATLRSYGSAVRAWRVWCETRGLPALPLEPLDVFHHLVDYAFEWDVASGDFARTAAGELRPVVALSSVEIRLHGINKAAEFLGLPRPGENPGLREAMRGLRRLLGASTVKRAALDFPRLRRCLQAAEGRSYEVLRSRAMVLTRARTAATTGQLVRLSWADVTLTDTHVVVAVPPERPGGVSREVTVPLSRNRGICLVLALHELREAAPALREVFTSAAAAPLSRQAPYVALNRAAAEFGGWNALPHLHDRDLPRVTAKAAPRTFIAVARDRALLLTGFYTAGRRSNLAALNWGDLTDFGEDGWSVLFRKSKTDQLGRGHTVWAPEDGTELCAASALRIYRAELQRVLGRPLRGDDPVFVSLDGGGKLKNGGRGATPRRLGGDGINEAVQRLAIAAGLMTHRPGERGEFGAHSLRAGFVTEALRDDKLSVPEVADVTGHADLNVLFGYRREVNAAKRNPARKLMEALGA